MQHFISHLFTMKQCLCLIDKSHFTFIIYDVLSIPCNKSQMEHLGVPKCNSVLICMHKRCLTTLLLYWFPWLLCFSVSLSVFCYLCAVKCLEPLLAVSQHVGNWRRRAKEGEEFIKPRTTSQFTLIYHITPLLSHSVPIHLAEDVCVCVSVCVSKCIIVAPAVTCRHTHKLSFTFPTSLCVLQHRQTGAAAVAGLT